MKRRPNVLYPFVLGCLALGMLLLVGCRNPTPTPTLAQGVNLVVVVDGDAHLKREGWSDYAPIDFGTPILHTDLLRVDGTLSVLCGDLSIRVVEGLDNVPCPPALGWMERDGAYYGVDASAGGGVRAGVLPDDVPYVQHPRNTLILDPRPLLRWHDTGAVSYTVAIVQSGSAIWRQDDVVGNEIRYPEDAPALQADQDYLLLVVDNETGKTSGGDPTRGIGFQVAAPAHREAIESHREAVLALPSLDEPTRDFAMATYYATWRPSTEEEAGVDTGRGLWGEAWLLLESAAETHDAPAVHLWTGDVLSAMKLPDEAEAAYQAALERAEALGDLESQAAAQAGLWYVTGDEVHREKAVELYERLGDEAAQQALEEEK